MFARRPRTSFLDDPAPPTWRFTGLTIRAALFLGFGLTLGVWLFAGYYLTQRISEVEDRAAEINARFRRSQALLSTVRAQVLLESVYVRDALLDSDPTADGTYRRRIEETYRTIDRAMERYVPVMDSSAELERVVQLRREIANFHGAMMQVLGTDSSRPARDARTLLNNEVVTKREVAIRVSEEVQALNRGAFMQQQTDMVAIYRVTQRRVWEGLGIALAVSLGIGLLATLYAGRLEGRVRRQQVKDAQNTRDLQQLSAKLITAQEEERRTIARELHDEVGQLLTAMKVELAVAQRAINESGGSGYLLNDARSIADGAFATVRDLSHLLHPAMLDDLGLAPAVEWYVRGFAKRHSIRVEVRHDHMGERLTPEIEASVYRIVQEALTNVVKHARASSCRVFLQRLPHTVLITIEDDGAGFDPTEAERAGESRGLGLVGIRERVSQLRGTLHLETAPDNGTRLTVELPARVRPSPEESKAVDPFQSAAEPVI